MTRKKTRRGRRRWYRMDLHLHTPASEDWRDPDVTFLDWLRMAEAKGLDIVAMTDHNTVAGYARFKEEIEHLEWLEQTERILPEEKQRLDAYRELLAKILVLPGFEFTAALGFHILGIFPPETPIRELEFLLLKLGIPADKLDEGATVVGATADVLTAYRLIREAGGIVIAAHANSSHGVMMRGLNIGGQTRIAYTQDPNLHALEVTDLGSRSRNSTARFFDGSKPEYPRRMHLIQGSDAHGLEADPKDKNRLGIGDRPTEIALEEKSFAAIKAVFESDEFNRIRKPRTRVQPDPVQEARRQGEGERLSFHKRITPKGGEQERILRDVVAMANGQGGRIIVGASGKSTEPVVGVERPRLTARELEEALAQRVVPPVNARVSTAAVRGKHVILIDVPPGTDKPYALDGQEIYVRRGKETRLAYRDEIIALVRQEPLPPEEPLPGTEVAEEKQEEPPKEALPRDGALEGRLPPGDGVEIVRVEERQGKRYYTIRDLRNHQVITDVTRESAKHLWAYAIQRYETTPVDPDRVTWFGDLGIWHLEYRAGKVRYDLVQRLPDGRLVVYYGVTEDGFIGPWADMLPIAREMAALHLPEHKRSPA